jgi:hypothetical protein
MRRALLMLLACSPLAALAQVPAAQDPLVGEWNLDAAACNQARVTYTADGRHESLENVGDGWTTRASGTWTRDGESVAVTFEGQTQTLEIVELDATRLVLRNPDPAQMEALGMEHVEFVRCPER